MSCLPGVFCFDGDLAYLKTSGFSSRKTTNTNVNLPVHISFDRSSWTHRFQWIGVLFNFSRIPRTTFYVQILIAGMLTVLEIQLRTVTIILIPSRTHTVFRRCIWHARGSWIDFGKRRFQVVMSIWNDSRIRLFVVRIVT